jgi:hypothetical protein
MYFLSVLIIEILLSKHSNIAYSPKQCQTSSLYWEKASSAFDMLAELQEERLGDTLDIV